MSTKFGWLDGDATATSSRFSIVIAECSHNGESVLGALEVRGEVSPRMASGCTGADSSISRPEVGNVSASSTEVIVGC
jgi:hypothetical protein